MEASTSCDDVEKETIVQDATRVDVPERVVGVKAPGGGHSINTELCRIERRRFSCISAADYLKTSYKVDENNPSLHILDTSYRDGSGIEPSSSYSVYRSSHRRAQTLVFHHSNYPTRTLEYLNLSSRHQLRPSDVRVAWSYRTRDFRTRDTGVLGDLQYPYSSTTVAPSYQQIRGVGCERSRDWTGRPLLKCVLRLDATVGTVVFSLAAILLIFMLTYLYELEAHTFVLVVVGVVSLSVIGVVLLLVNITRWDHPGVEYYQSTPPEEHRAPTWEEVPEDCEAPASVVIPADSVDLPPPYEAPPDYNSLAPEILMNASTLAKQHSTTKQKPLDVISPSPDGHKEASDPHSSDPQLGAQVSFYGSDHQMDAATCELDLSLPLEYSKESRISHFNDDMRPRYDNLNNSGTCDVQETVIDQVGHVGDFESRVPCKVTDV